MSAVLAAVSFFQRIYRFEWGLTLAFVSLERGSNEGERRTRGEYVSQCFCSRFEKQDISEDFRNISKIVHLNRERYKGNNNNNNNQPIQSIVN